ncbi:Abi-alpha family protein [Bradyrhizobium sp. LB13.1]
MSDDPMPYEKAIEETAKTTGKMVDLVRDGARAISPTVADAYNFLMGDRLSHARKRNLDAIARETDNILRDRDVKDRSATPEQIAIPLLSAAEAESRDELRSLWSRLLANAVDPSRSERVRPEFIKLLQSLEPLDARVLKFLHTKSLEDHVSKFELYARVGCRTAAGIVSVDHLVELKTLRMIGGGDVLAMTELGIELMFATEL